MGFGYVPNEPLSRSVYAFDCCEEFDFARTVVQIPVALVEREEFGRFLTALNARQFAYVLHLGLSAFAFWPCLSEMHAQTLVDRAISAHEITRRKSGPHSRFVLVSQVVLAEGRGGIAALN